MMRSVFAAVMAIVIIHVAAVVAVLGSLVLSLVRRPAGWHVRRFVLDVVIGHSCRLILWFAGIDIVVVGDRQWSQKQTVYVFNHTSTLDMFVVCTLGLPNVRFFLKRKALWFVPMGVLALLSGTFLTAPQYLPAVRTQLFVRATAILKQTGESVFLSPEGTRVTSGLIGPFNKGAFHLATELQAPIVPLFVQMDRQLNPGRSWLARRGTLRVHILPAVSVASWTVGCLSAQRDEVREMFVAAKERLGQPPAM